MVEHLHHLVRAAHAQDGDSAPNMWTRDRLAVVHARVEDVTPGMLREAAPIPVEPRVDTIVSECLGVLLVHERMCETLLEARDRFLKPDGAVFPRVGILCFSLLNDARMWQEVRARGEWWNTTDFYGIDLTPFVDAARAEAFASPVVGLSLIHI